MTTSIQSRLTLYIVAGAVALLVASSAVVEHLIRRQLMEEFDRGLLNKARLLASQVDREGRLVEFDFSYDFMPEFEFQGEDIESDEDQEEDGEEEEGVDEEEAKTEFFELWLSDGTSFARSNSLQNERLHTQVFPDERPRYRDLILPDGRRGRMISFGFEAHVDIDDEADAHTEAYVQADEEGEVLLRIPEDLPADTPIGLSVAVGTEELFDVLGAVRSVLLVSCLFLIITIGLFVRYCVRHGFKPLRQIANEVQQLDSTRLGMRITQASESTELKPITDQLNHLLERLEQAFEREKRFSGNVAHELRTPIAELRTLSEVGQRWPGDKEMVSDFFADLISLADDMERTVTNLLNLARLDAGQHDVEFESFNLSEIVQKCWKQVALQARGREISLDNRVSDEIWVKTDRDKLVLILVNLFSNAVHYSPTGGAVVAQIQEDNARIQLSISNVARNLEQNDLPLMFERFWRKDRAQGKGRYAGLGLSLVAALSEILGVIIRPNLDSHGNLTMTLSGFEAN